MYRDLNDFILEPNVLFEKYINKISCKSIIF